MSYTYTYINMNSYVHIYKNLFPLPSSFWLHCCCFYNIKSNVTSEVTVS